MGHKACSCTGFLEDIVRNEVKEDKVGPWIKADQLGKRVDGSKENVDPNNKRESSINNDRIQKPKPVSLLRVFSNLSMNEDNIGTSKGRVMIASEKTNTSSVGVAEILRREENDANEKEMHCKNWMVRT